MNNEKISEEDLKADREMAEMFRSCGVSEYWANMLTVAIRYPGAL